MKVLFLLILILLLRISEVIGEEKTPGHVIGAGKIKINNSSKIFRSNLRYEEIFTEVKGYFWYKDKKENITMQVVKAKEFSIDDEGKRAIVKGSCKINGKQDGYKFVLIITDVNKNDRIKLELIKNGKIIYTIGETVITKGNVRVHKIVGWYNAKRQRKLLRIFY